MPALPTALGPRSSEIMCLFWSQPTALRGRDVYRLLNLRHDLAYTTVMSLLNRLVEHGLLNRSDDSVQRGYVYRPVYSAETYIQAAMAQLRAQFGLPANERAVGAR